MNVKAALFILIYLQVSLFGEDLLVKNFEKVTFVKVCKIYPNKNLDAAEKRIKEVEQFLKKENMNEERKKYYEEQIKKNTTIIEMHQKYKNKILGYPIVENFEINEILKSNLILFFKELQNLSTENSAKLMNIAGCFFISKYVIEILDEKNNSQYIVMDFRDPKEESFPCSRVYLYELKKDELQYLCGLRLSDENVDTFKMFEVTYLNNKKLANNNLEVKDEKSEKEKAPLEEKIKEEKK